MVAALGRVAQFARIQGDIAEENEAREARIARGDGARNEGPAVALTDPVRACRRRGRAAHQ